MMSYLVAKTVKNLPSMEETWVQSLGWEDPLEKGMATHWSILAWRIPWTEKPGGRQFMGFMGLFTVHVNKELDMTNHGKSKSSRKTSISALLTMPKPLTVWISINCGKFWERWEYQTTWPASWKICIQVRKQQLELDMEQQTGSK